MVRGASPSSAERGLLVRIQALAVSMRLSMTPRPVCKSGLGVMLKRIDTASAWTF